MHLSLEELLAVREGAGSPETVVHLDGCSECAGHLAHIDTIAEGLRSLPRPRPQRDGWLRLRAELRADRQRSRLVRSGWIAASLAAAVSLVVIVRGTVETLREVRIARTTATLVQESQQLERRLRARGGGVVNGRTAGAIVALEDRIAYIDARLGARGERQPAGEEVSELWQERVQLLDALVDLQESGVTYVGL